MTIYRVEGDQAVVKPIRTSWDLAELLSVYPVDLEELEQDMMKVEQQSVPVIHHFGPGVYMREARLNAGNILIGHKQVFPQSNVMLTGRVTMDNGTELVAPMSFTGGPGRKCGVIHEDTAWLNIYATDEQDIGTIESIFLDKSEAALAQEKRISETKTSESLAANEDFGKMLSDLGVSAYEVETMSNYQEDRIKLPWGAYAFRTAPSPIQGQGVFATAPIAENDLIGPANIRGKRTVLGWGVNHSGTPNAKMVKCPTGINLVATRAIGGNLAGLLGEEITVDYRQARKVALSCLQQ